MVNNNVYGDEWSGAGMYMVIQKIVESDQEEFLESFLLNLLDEAINF